MQSSPYKSCVLILKVFGFRQFNVKFKKPWCFCVSLQIFVNFYLKFKLHVFCWRWFFIATVVTKSFSKPISWFQGDLLFLLTNLCQHCFFLFLSTKRTPGLAEHLILRTLFFELPFFCTFLSNWHFFHQIPQKTNLNLE